LGGVGCWSRRQHHKRKDSEKDEQYTTAHEDILSKDNTPPSTNPWMRVYGLPAEATCKKHVYAAKKLNKFIIVPIPEDG
jgi:hypothetical protein